MAGLAPRPFFLASGPGPTRARGAVGRAVMPGTAASRVLVATRSLPVHAAPGGDAPLVTEVVTGERLEVLGARVGWLEVVVPSHATRLDPRGYPGWVREDATTENEGWRPTVKIVAPNAANLPLGAPLEGSGGVVRRPDGREVRVDPGALRPVDEPVGASGIEVSRSLLGLPYRWGGTDSTTGMDCSGMVYRVTQLLGTRVPRDADDQFESAPFKSREHWEGAYTGDLVFFGEESVTHVGFYLGNGTYISEHGVGETVVRGMDEDPYWGFARYGRGRP